MTLYLRQAFLLKGRRHELDGKWSFLNPTFNLFTKHFYSTYHASGITPSISQMLIHLVSSQQAQGEAPLLSP